MDANDWNYAGEGKLTLAVANVNSKSIHYGFVLLIHKVKDYVQRNIDHALQLNEDVQFIENIMRPWFGLYISDRMEICHLDDIFLLSLNNKIAVYRPNGRIQDKTRTSFLNYAFLQRNFHFIYRALPNESYYCLNVRNDSLTFELKVKCGLKSTSPFIPKHHDIKLHYSSFSLMQLYKLSKSIEVKGDFSWGKFSKISKYNPSSLFSRDFHKVQDSLLELIKEPQNNLKITLNGNHMFGLDKINLDSLKFEIMSSSFNQQHSNNEFSFNSLIDSICSILCAEDALKRIEAMQNLDIIGIEGADLIYKRLLKLLGSKSEIDKYLKTFFILPLQSSSMEFGLNNHSYNSLNLPDLIKKLISYRINDMMTCEERSIYHEMAIDLIENSTEIEDLALLLKWWHLSLVAKDVSVMISLQPISYTNIDSYEKIDSNQAKFHVICQSTNTCGIVNISPILDSPVIYAYSIAIVDIGCKSLDKIWTKNDSEDSFCDVCKSMIENYCA